MNTLPKPTKPARTNKGPWEANRRAELAGVTLSGPPAGWSGGSQPQGADGCRGVCLVGGSATALGGRRAWEGGGSRGRAPMGRGFGKIRGGSQGWKLVNA